MTKALELAKFGREVSPTGAVVGDTDTQTLSSKTFSDGPVFSGNGVNGVPYLNASKVFTTASTFVFDGSNLGIGTASPSAKIHISTNNESAAIFENNAGQPALIRLKDTSTTTAPYIASYGNALAFGKYGSAETMRIDASGNVGINKSTGLAARLDVVGTTNISAKLTISTFGSRVRNLEVYGSDALFDAGDGIFDMIIGDGGFAYMSLQTTDNATALKIRNHTGNADIATFERTTGNVGIGTASPAGRLEVRSASAVGNAVYFRGGTYSDIAYATGIRFLQPASTTNANRQFRFTSGDQSLTIQGIDGSGSDVSDTPLIINPSGGSVGIGTSSPGQKLEVAGSTQTGIIYSRIANNYGSLTSNGAGTGLQFYGWDAGITANIKSIRTGQAYSPSALTFETFGGNGIVGSNTLAERMRIDDYGKVLIGTNSAPSTNATTWNLYSTGMIAGGGGYTYGVYGGSSGNLTLTANAYPANTGSTHYVSIASGSSGGGGPDEIARFTNQGRVGIGLTNPQTKLDVAGVLRFTPNPADTGYTADIFANYNSEHPFQINVKNNGSTAEYFGVYASAGGSDNRVVFPTGNVGIGTTTPGAKLDVLGDFRISRTSAFTANWNFGITYTSAADYGSLYMSASLSTSNAVWVIGGTERMRLTSGGSLTLGNNPTQGYGSSSGYLAGFQSGGSQTFISIAKSGQTLDSGGMAIGMDNVGGSIYIRPDQPLDIYTNNTMSLRINGGTKTLQAYTSNVEQYHTATLTRYFGHATTARTLFTVASMAVYNVKAWSSHNSGGNYSEYAIVRSTNGSTMTQLHNVQAYAAGYLAWSFNTSTGEVTVPSNPYGVDWTIVITVIGQNAGLGCTGYITWGS